MSLHDDSEETGVSARQEPDARTRPTKGAEAANVRRRSWLHTLFAVHGDGHVLARSAVVSASFFLALSLLSTAWGLDGAYLDSSTFLGLSALLGSVGVFVVLVVLGTWVTGYAAVWRAVEPCFRVEGETYETFLDARLIRLYDVRPVLVLFVLLDSAFVLVVTELDPSLRHDVLLAVINAVLAFLVLTAGYMFVVHVDTVRRALQWEFANVYTAARTLEPLVRFSIAVAVWWFVGVSLLAVYYWFALSDSLRLLLSRAGVGVGVDGSLSGPLLGVVGHATLLGLLIAVGFAVVAVPTWQLHVALSRAKRDC